MFLFMTFLAALISAMFVRTVASSIAGLRKERDDLEDFARRYGAF